MPAYPPAWLFLKQGRHDFYDGTLWWTFQAVGLGSILYMVGLLAACPLLPTCLETISVISGCEGLWCLATPTTGLLVAAIVACWGNWAAQAGWALSCWRQDEGPNAQQRDQQEEAQVCAPAAWHLLGCSPAPPGGAIALWGVEAPP